MHTSNPPPTASAVREAETAEDAVLVTLMQLGRRMRQRFAADDLDPAVMPLLHILRCTGSMRLSDLAARLRLDASTVSRHIRSLEERGLIARTEDPDDRRASQVALGTQGEKALTAAMDRRRAAFAEVLADWSDADREQLRSLLVRFAGDLRWANDRDDHARTTENS